MTSRKPTGPDDRRPDHRGSGAGPAVPGPIRGAAAVAAAEGAGLVALGGYEAARTAVDRPTSLGGALAAAGLAIAAGALVLVLARGLVRLELWSRTPVLLLQLLALPIGYSLAFPSGRPLLGIPVLALAAAELSLLFMPGTRAALDRPLPPGH